jgi:Fe-S-cluster-containing dehydrogenase component
MMKCDLCSERIKYGFEPACVHTCPTKALKFGEINEQNQQIEGKAVSKLWQGHASHLKPR